MDPLLDSDIYYKHKWISLVPANSNIVTVTDFNNTLENKQWIFYLYILKLLLLLLLFYDKLNTFLLETFLTFSFSNTLDWAASLWVGTSCSSVVELPLMV